ncbi:MAG: phage tail protein [Oscillospiraceae bacterium]
MSTGEKVLHFFVNQHPEPLPGYKFKVYIMGLCMGFTKITNLQEVAETIPLQEGGVNDRVYSLVAPVTAESTLVMERGVVLSTVVSMLLNPLAIGSSIPGDILITLHNRNGFIGRCFMVNHAYVKKISYDGVDSMNGNPIIQRFELCYEKLETIGLPGVPDVFY